MGRLWSLRLRTKILFGFVLVLVMGCNPVLEYARTKYPNCKVESVDDDTVLVECPDRKPFEKDFKRVK